MQNRKITVFQQSLEDLVESLDATLRVASSDSAEALPESLESSASQLMTRLAVAGRLASGVFNGSARDAARVKALTGAMRRLEAAYLVYVKELDSSVERDEACRHLSVALDHARKKVSGAE